MFMIFKDLPTEILEKCKLRAYAQGVTLNERANIKTNKNDGGFTWGQTVEGNVFWSIVLIHDNYDYFYRKYPKNSKLLIKCL